MFRKVLIANRGAIACRIVRTLDRMGIASVAVHSEADRYSRHVAMAGEAVAIGPAPAAESYLSIARILDAAKRTGAEAIHPGYGFLSENADFAEACAAAGIVFIGPRPEHIRAFGLKHEARALAAKAGVPLAPGTGLIADLDTALADAGRLGFPVMLKSTAGGGGIGLQRCADAADLRASFDRVRRLAEGNFKDGGVYLERFVEQGRHIEVQVFGDGRGEVLALGERDCSAQRRNQKVVEETPAPDLPDATRQAMFDTAGRLCRSVNYANAGTVEFLYDRARGDFFFLEVNTRLQVEHGVTEEVTGIDLVEWMLRQAAGEALPAVPPAKGCAIQVRLYAENPARDFRPSTGQVTGLGWPDGARIDTWLEPGAEITPYYDPMLAKLIVTAPDRPQAVAKLEAALAATRIEGIETNLDYLRALAAAPAFVAGEVTTATLATLPYRPRVAEILEPGLQTTVQDWPGRVGYWDVGVPPSGPMDALSFRLANRALGNAPGAPGLEITLSGPTIRFDTDTTICLAGAAMPARLDATPIPFWEPVPVRAGQMLAIGTAADAGARAYLAFAGGLRAPRDLGAAACFTLGRMGAFGRALRAGDMLWLDAGDGVARPVPEPVRPTIARRWEIGVLYGPHGAPDFFTDRDIATLFAQDWEVHHNSSRTGVRLIGPRPDWARPDGGEAGLHPSNIHDNAYAIGAIDFTGDMPVILGPDGPSLGGFVCPAVVATAERWKLGQLRPGDRLRFRRWTPDQAVEAERRQEATIARLDAVAAPAVRPDALGADDAVLARTAARADRPEVVYRRAGDRYLLVEYGPPVLDIALRLHVHQVMEQLRASRLPGIVDLTPGIRSLQVHIDPAVLPLGRLLDALQAIERDLPPAEARVVPSRIVHLPLSWDDPATRLAIAKYAQSVRPDAPWCPSNIEFIRRINGLADEDAVKRIVFDASYLVLGLGDVYLGAPVATPLDPRHRLVTTKYNPARTWTPENAVGIGGAYLCVYGMEGPGGYQFVGRTCQVWNLRRPGPSFAEGKPWLLRFFDRIRFHPVSAEELLAFREDFARGKTELKIERGEFILREYQAFIEANAQSIAAFKTVQQRAFEAERRRWAEAGVVLGAVAPDAPLEDAEDTIPPGCVALRSPAPGSVWKVEVAPGARVRAGDRLVTVESMKMELGVDAPGDGSVVELRCAPGRPVALGQVLVVVSTGRAEPA